MMLLLTSLAVAATPFDPGASGKKCDKDPADTELAQEELEGLAYLVMNEPVVSTSAEQKRRLKAVNKLAKGYICTRQDALNASLVLVTSRSTKDLELAYAFAVEASEDALPQSHFVATAAMDRVQISQGMPQQFGTQTGFHNGEGDGCFHPVADTLTDDERKQWSVAPLSTLIADYLASKGHAGQEPNQGTLGRLNLLCISEKW